MLWTTLFRKISKQPLKFTQNNHVFALLENPKTHKVEKMYLDLNYDASGHPYFIERRKNTDKRKGKLIYEKKKN